MSRYRFVEPEIVRLDLSDGDWIEVKKELNVGEARKVADRSQRAVTNSETGESVVDSDLNSVALLEAYLVGWSFVDKRGTQTKPTAATIRALDQPTFLEIVQALGVHVGKVREAQQADPIAAEPAATSA
jgi:hypothetical protein